MNPSTHPLFALLRSGLDALELPADQEQIARWLAYIDLLARWNQAYNLTAIREPRDMLHKHLLDSLAMAPHWSDQALADMGTGAGLPGIPLAILFPERRVVLIESNGKKVRFLREARRVLGLTGVDVVESRAERYQAPEPLPAATARAVAPVAEMLGWCRPWLASNGVLLAMKGPGYAEELAALPVDFSLEAVHPLHVPGLTGERVLLVLRRDTKGSV